MANHRPSRLALPAVMATVLSVAPAARADESVDTGTWDTGFATGECGSGTTTRVCTYGVHFTNCQEASASTGGPRLVIPCDVDFAGSVSVQPRLNGAGRTVGCTSVVGSASGQASYDSNVADEFDALRIPILDITVQSGHPDQAIALVHFTGRTTDGVKAWIVDGALAATCAPSDESLESATAGTVDVVILTGQ